MIIFGGTSKLFHNRYVIFHSHQQGTKVALLHIIANICYILFIIHILKGYSERERKYCEMLALNAVQSLLYKSSVGL